MKEREHLLEVLNNVITALKKQDYLYIKELSNQIIHQASIEQDPDIISLAVVIYSLSKIIERQSYKNCKNWDKFYRSYTKDLEQALISLNKNDIETFRKHIHHIRNLIQNLSGNLKGFISEVFRKAQINKASRIYEHGISMEKTANILGVSIWELAEYAGKTGISNVNFAITMPIQQRIKLAEEIFE